MGRSRSPKCHIWEHGHGSLRSVVQVDKKLLTSNRNASFKSVDIGSAMGF